MYTMNLMEEVLTEPAALVVAPNEGTMLHAFDSAVQIKLSSAQTQGTLVVALADIAPHSGPPPHIHSNEDEIFLIVEGQYRVLLNDQWSEVVGPGTVVYLPRGSRHTFENVGDTTARHWILATPGGFEQFFAKCADVFTEAVTGPPDMERIVAISDEHGIQYVPRLSAPQPRELDMSGIL